MKIVFFDGYCTLCNGFVDWLMRIDKGQVLKFASLQGATTEKILGSSKTIPNGNSDSVIYHRDGLNYERSLAILLILSDTGGLWKAARIFQLVPKFVRNAIYRLVANNRYRFFKKRETCRLPTADERERLLN